MKEITMARGDAV